MREVSAGKGNVIETGIATGVIQESGVFKNKFGTMSKAGKGNSMRKCKECYARKECYRRNVVVNECREMKCSSDVDC